MFIQVVATDINDQGAICGTMIVADIGFRGFVYDHGVWTVLPPVVDMLGTWSSAAAINNDGIVVGQRSITENLNPQNAYIWSADEGFTDLGVMKGPNSAATAISQGGLVSGWTGGAAFGNDVGFLWHTGRLSIMGAVPGGFTSTPQAITEIAIVVGSGTVPAEGFPNGVSRAFLWEAGRFTMLGTLRDHLISRAHAAIEKPRQVVGTSWYVDGNPNIRHAFIWQSGAINDFNSLIPSDIDLLMTCAAAIAQDGRIVGTATTPDGIVAVLLTPDRPPLGDLDGDCQVGVFDLFLLLAKWGQTDSDADLDDDGVVGILDLLMLVANWT